MRLSLIIIIFSALLFSGCFNSSIAVVPDELNISNLPINEDGRLEVDTYHQDQKTEIIDLKVTQVISNITLDRNYSVGEEYLNITSLVAPQVGDYLCLKDKDGSAFMQTELQVVTSLGGDLYQVELEMELDFPFSIDDGCSIQNTNMAVDGSVNKQIFFISPLELDPSVKWHITRMICSATGDDVSGPDGTPDSTSFLLTDATSHGIYFRVSNAEKNKNLFYATTNKELKERMYDLDINTIKNKNGYYGATFRRTFNGLDKNGVVLELTANSTSTDFHRYEVVIDRDLTGLVEFDCVIQGHVTD